MARRDQPTCTFLYRREGELEGEEVARKGRDEEVYPEGDDDDLMGIETEDKDTQKRGIS